MFLTFTFDSSPRSTTPDDKYSLSAKLDGIPNQCKTAEAEDEVKGDKTTKITITSIRTQEDKNSSESSSYCQADKILNQPLKQISENETEYETGITSKDIEIGGHKIEAINDTNIEEYDLDIENEEVSNLACAGEQNLEVHEQEPSSDNSDSSHDKHASIEVISDSTEKQKITSQTNENTIPEEKEDADLQHIEQATIISEANLGLNNEVLIPNIELETENLYKDDERVTESGVKDEDKDNKCTSHSITHVEDENKDTSLIGVQNKTEGISYVEEGEWKALDSISFSNNLVYDNDNNREDKSVQGKTEDSSKASQDTGINLSNDAEEQENVPALYTGEKSDIEDGSQIIQEEAKEIEPETGRQLQETAAKGVPEQEAQSTVFTLAIVEDGTIEKTIQEKTHKEEESTTIDGDKSYTPENEHEQAAKVLEEIDLLKTTTKVRAENEEHADQKSEAQSSENMTTKHIDLDEMEKTESILKSSYDIIEQEQTPELLSYEHREINDGGKIITEEAIGVLEVQTIHPPPTIESVIVETSDKSIQEEIHNDAESAVTDTEHGQTRANEFDDKTNVLEAFELHEVNGSTSEENEKNVEPQSEASLDTIAFKHPDLQRLESTEINPSNDTEEQENVMPSGTGEKSEIKDGPQIIQEEAKEIELATEKQLPVTAIESVPEEDAPSIAATATLALVQSGITEKTIQEPILIDDEKSCTKENEHDQATKVLEVINLPETMSKISVESVEHADQKSEAQRSESVITKHVDSEEMVKMESIEKESHDVKEVEKSLELPSDEHQEINDGGKILPEEVLGVPEDKNLQSLPVIASTIVESADKSIQEEINKDVELAITYTEEGPRTEIEFEERTDVLEPRVDNKETENLQAPDIGEKLEVKDGNEILQGEAKEMEQETKKQFPEAGIESVPEQEAPSTVLTLAIVEDGTIEKTIQEKTYKEEESTTIDEDKSYTPENEHEQAAKILEEIDLLKTTTKVRAENEEHADQKSEAQSSENMTTKHIDSDEMETTESILKSSYDIIEQEQTPELPFAENWDINDGEKIITEKATGVPEVQTIQPPPTIESFIVETFDKSIQEEIDKDAKSAVTDTEEGQTGANDFEDKTNVLEASELHEVNGSTFEENEKNAEPQSEASLDTIALKHPNLRRLESTEINLSNDTEEQENVQPSGTGEKSEIKDGPQILQEEAKEVELATEKQLAVTAIESVPEDKTLQSLPVIASTRVENADKSIQEEIHKDVELAITDTEEGPRAEIEFEERTDVLEVRVDHKETENLQAPDIGEKLEVKDGDEILQGEAKEMEQGTKKQLPEAGIESVPEQEALSTVPTLAIVEDGTTEKLIQEKTHKEEESTKIDDDKSCTRENEHEQAAKVLEAIDLLKTTSMVSAENEEHADQKSEAQSSENMINKHIDSDEMEKTESSQKSSYDIIEQEQSPELPSAENREINDGGKIILEEATGVPEVQTIHPPPTIESVIVETFHKNIEEEIHKDAESAVTDTKEGQTRANEFDDKTIVPEAINLPETKSKVSAESVEHADQKSEAQRSESVITRHVDSEEMVKMENIEKESHDVKEVEESPELPAVEHQEINDGGKIIPEEVLGVPEDQTLQSLPVIASIRDENADESIQEEIHKDVESAITDTEEEPTAEIEYQERTNVLEAFDIHEEIHKDVELAITDTEEGPRAEIEFEERTDVLEAIGLPETMSKGSAENEELANNKSEAQSDENVITKHINSEETGTTEDIEKSSYDVKDLEKTLELPSAENREINDRGEIIQEEAIGVPEDQMLQPPPTIESVVVQTFDKSIQEEIHKDGKSAVTDTEEGQTSENEFEGKTNVLEAYDLHKVISSTTEENEKKAKPQSEMSLESTVLKLSNLEGLGTTELNPGNDTDELENFLASDTVEKSDQELPSVENREIKESVEITPVEAIGIPADQTLPSLPIIESIGVENVNYSMQEKVQGNSKLALSDTEEEQKQENEFEDKTNALQEFKMDELIAITCEENDKKAEPESEASIDTTVLKHPDLELLETTEVNLNNETEEQENVLASDTGKKLEIKDGPQIIDDEAKEIELATENQLPESATETIVEGGTVEKTSLEKTQEEEESKPIDDDKNYSPENEYEQATKVVEAIDVPKTTSKANAENEENAIQKSDEQSIENVNAKHVNSEEMVTLENIEKSSYDVKEVEMTPELPSADSQEINDSRKILLGEALGVPRDQTLQPLPSIAFDGVKTGDKSIQEQIHTHGESTVVNTEEGQTHQIEFEDKTKVLEAFDLLDENACTSKENREKAELQSDASTDNIVLKHLNLEALETTKLNPSIDTDEPKNVSAPDTGEELEIKDYSHIIQEEAKGVELATERQLLDAVTEREYLICTMTGVPEQEAQSTVSPLAIDEGGTIEKVNQEQTHEEEESTPVDEDKSCARENENEQATEVLEAIGLSETMSKASVQNEEHDDQKSEAQSIENLTTKHIESEEMTTKEKIEISSYDVHDLERTPELPSSENEEINEGGTNTLEEEIGVPEDQTLQPLPTAESGVDETVDKSIEEDIHKDGKLTVTDTEEGLNHENEPVENVLEESNLHEVVAITNNEIEKKVESQSESILNTTALKHTSLEGLETIEINPGIETEEPENVPVSDTGKKLEMDGGAKIIKEEENVMELTTEKQLPEASTASINEQEDLSTPVIVEGGTLEKLIQEHAHEEEESTPIDDNKNNTPDNKHEQESVVDEEIDLPKTMSTFSAENEEHADHKSEAQCSNVIARHIDSEDMVTKECIEKSTYDVKLLEKTHELPSSENQEINDSEKITPQEAIGVSDNESLQSPPTIACRGVEIVDKNIQKETHKDNESAVTETEEEHRHENEYDGKTNVLEAFDLHEVIASTSEENGEKSEPQLEVNLDTIVLKHLTDPSLEGLETTEINKSIDTGKPENVSASNTGEKLEIKDGSEIIQEKAKEMELANEFFLPETTTKSVPEQEAPSTTPTSATPEVGTLEKIIQEQTNEEEESTLEDEQENETKVLEVIGLPETMSKISAENEEHAEQKTESQSSVNTITKHIDSEETITTESIEKSNDVKELQNTPGVPQDQTLQPLTTIAYVGVESIDRSIQEEIHKDDESTVTNSREEKTHENKFEDKMKVLEGFGLHEIIASTSDENENKAEPEPEPEASLNSNVIKHHDLEELETIEINSSNDTEEPENVLASDIGENLEIKDGAEIILVEAKKIELATEKQLLETATGSVPEQKATSTMLTPEIVQGGTVDKTIQEQTREEDESTPIDDEKRCNPENEVHEESNLDKATGNEKKSNPQSDEHNLETTVIQQPNLEGHETTEIGSGSDIETEQISEIKDGGKTILEEEEKEMEDATDKQLLKSSEQSVIEDEAQTVLVPTSEFVEGETIEKSFQEETLKEEQSTAIDNDKSRRPENELEQTTEVLEPGECIAGRNFQAEAQRETSIPGTNLVSLNQIEDVDLPDVRKFESGENFATPNEDFSSSTTIDASEGPQRDESKNTLYSSSSLIPREVEKEDKAESFNRADIENTFDKNDARTNENIEEQTIDYENSLVEAKISLPIEGIVDKVKDHDVENFEATDSIEQRDIKDLSFENDPARKEAAPRDSDKVIESEAIEKLEIRELETDQIGSAKGGEGEDEFEKISPSSSDIVMIKDSQDSDVRVSPKKHHGILSGVGSKVKHSISKVKKAITGKSSHSKTSSEK
ncbi:hypothetical protein TanjilG_13660 [Lupinus angustifolius]|uniref:Uncharacterized protein n=1 Tax=Lupinus angustifolius TaxID=3871 RepID=A0A1J7GR58_LUPAN|nr:hypothetical protein TanjilG_13660 [Lupinus angustifolius]